MRPERSRETGRAARVARARLLLKAELPWIGGYPTAAPTPAGLPWCVPPSAGRPERTLVVDRASLHRATRALKDLTLRFEDVLDDVLDEPRVWMEGARTAVDLLKPFLHDPAPRTTAKPRGSRLAKPNGKKTAKVQAAPADGGSGWKGAPLASGLFRRELVASVRSAPAGLEDVLAAASWVCVVRPSRLAPIATFLRGHEGACAALRRALAPDVAERAALHLALLAGDEGARRVEPLARLLAAREVYEAPTGGQDYARALAKNPRGPRPPRPGATLGPTLAAYTTTLLAAEARARAGALGLLGALDLAHLAREWSSWWNRIAACEKLARSQPESDDDARARAKATRLTETTPRALHGRSVEVLLQGFLSWGPDAQRAALRVLEELPAFERNVAVRLSFLEHWTELAADARPGALGALLAALATYLARTRAFGPRRLSPWARVFASRGTRPMPRPPPDDVLVEHVPQARWPAFFEALARAVEDAASDAPRLAQSLLAVVPLEADAAHALALARALAPVLGALRQGDALRVAFELCGHDAALFGQAVAVIGKANAETERGELVRGLEAVRRSGGDELSRSLLLEESTHLIACGRRLAVLALLGETRGVDAPRAAPADTRWTSTYPAWVVPSLTRLAESDVHAERAAHRLLGDDARSVAAVRRELAHLESRVLAGDATDRMRRRIVNLKTRLAAPRTPGAEQRAHLVAKVERAARRAKLVRFEQALDARLRPKLSSLFEQETPPSWLLAPRTIKQLAPVASFNAGMRALALRLLRVRAGPPPWDLRDDPTNRAFLDRLADAGVDVGPWLDGIGVHRVTTADGKVVDLRLEDDPLEILDMGEHFGTCLSPGAMNYFSTFANIADANKRVLYGRDPAGTLLARCLLALTSAGGMVAFHPYAHDATLGFPAMVAAFVRDLAARMRVIPVTHGEVPRLVSTEWYDDGLVDLGERFPFLQDGAPFRLALPTVTPAAFVEEAARLFAPLALGALTLPLLVALPEMDTRPELLAPLLPALATAEGLPLETMARAAVLLGRTAELVASSGALLPRIVTRVVDGASRQGNDAWLDGPVARIVQPYPADALRLLRATRERGVRSWVDETDPRRLEMAARATEALRRPRDAAALYRLASSRAWNVTSSQTLLRKAEALEATLSGRRHEDRGRPRAP